MSTNLLGIGLYSLPDAATILRITPSRLRRWVRGYTYWANPSVENVPRTLPPVLRQTEIPIIRGRRALSFLELMELRVVRVLVDEFGVPLQSVRAAAIEGKHEFGTQYPFATRTVFAEGRKIFASLIPGHGKDEVIELRRGRTSQVQLARLYEPQAKEVEYDPKTALAAQWWPLGKEVPVVLDPKILFGAPTIARTRIRTAVAADMANLGNAEDTARAYGVPVEGIRAAVRFERFLAAA